MSSVKPTENDYVPTITNIALNFNNNAGLLSSATLQDLYSYSVKAGSNQSFNEFCGQANSLVPFSFQGGDIYNSLYILPFRIFLASISPQLLEVIPIQLLVKKPVIILLILTLYGILIPN